MDEQDPLARALGIAMCAMFVGYAFLGARYGNFQVSQTVVMAFVSIILGTLGVGEALRRR
mgnify:FL=1